MCRHVAVCLPFGGEPAAEGAQQCRPQQPEQQRRSSPTTRNEKKDMIKPRHFTIESHSTESTANEPLRLRVGS